MILAKLKQMLSTRALVLFPLLMLLKSYLAWFIIFEDGPSWTTLLKEVPFVLVVFCLIEWFASKRKLKIYVFVNLLITGIYFAVIMYYKYYGVVVTYHALKQVNQVTAVSNSVFSLMDPYFLFIFTDVVVLIYILLRRKQLLQWKKAFERKEKRRVIAILFGLSALICFFNVLPNRASMNDVVKAEQMGIMNYEIYTLLDREKTELIPFDQITQASIDALKGVTKPSTSIMTGAAKGKNVIIIQLESFQNFLINLKIDGHEITPVMNSLVKENFYFPHFYQQVGQGNTSDAEFVVNTSFYIPPQGAATQMYADKQLPSLPKLVKEQGYDTATFHTNVVEFWNRGELYKGLGFDRYYDKSFFGEDDKVFFGSSDEVLYAKTAAELEKMDHKDNPFYAQVISMTAHHPFTIPEDKYKMTLPERYEGNFVGDYVRAQNYADYALGLFIADLKQRGVWDNSLIFIYGDHVGLPVTSLNRDEKALMQEIYGREYDYNEMVNIPLIMASPGITYPARFEQLGGQVDIVPTIANMLGISMENHLHFGQDILNQVDSNLLPEQYYLPKGSFVNSSELFTSGSGFGDGKHYPIYGDGSKPIEATESEFERALKLLHYSDSYVSQLPDRDSQSD
ncbi:LTA synthase family protein [Paenibacillus psychroresistens]|uniref:LTA synthase family protein n=1 Tax=Paenibacillus psychroresistens TaxID=1778678 RepID=A0A6B8RNJ7_9BACL|nr:LTA synthase family protein [Paenibacillus psychroresistens]QGQ97900.1 LTA synthase family protein [Paenibacillus psychroresistens]